MKRTKIRYQKTKDDKIKIVDIENAADITEIREEFGYEVMRLYEKSSPRYLRSHLNPGRITIFMNRGTHVPPFSIEIVKNGGIIEKHNFEEAVRIMKMAGMSLKKIINDVVSYETREVLI